jgi:acyl homoserine lactone synthase
MELIMHAIALDNRQAGRNFPLLLGMYRLRRRVFKDRLGWAVSVSGELELDIYDALNPDYLLVLSAKDEVIGCVRLLPTVGPNMLADTFPTLLGESEAPRSEDILESSRFCVDTSRAVELGRNGLNRATFMLFAAMIEFMQAKAARSIVTVTDTRMERILRRAGWALERLAEPQVLGSTTALAGYLHNSQDALEAMYRHAGVEGPVLIVQDAARKAA